MDRRLRRRGNSGAELAQLKREQAVLGWPEVLADAERRLRHLKVYEKRLRASIRLFKAKVEAGEPLPLAEYLKITPE